MSDSVKQSHKIKVEILELLKAIQRGIKYGCVPLRKTLNTFSSATLENCGFLTEMRSSTNYNKTIENRLVFADNADKAKLCEFFSRIGKSTCCEMELILCKEYIEYFENITKLSESQVKSKSALYKKMGLIAGILSVIILI